jgi:murein L,D-transpeptidase YafK
MKSLILAFVLVTGLVTGLIAQPTSKGPSYSSSFIEYQKALPRPGDAMKRKEDTLQKQFEAKGLKWPAKYLYFRSFKYDSQFEVWVRNDLKEPFKLFKSYRVCALAGTLGPKRMEGDYQVPEGFYYINEFNPKSSYHLSLGLNYPNASDMILSDSMRPGSAIYVHGSCVTVGCIPLTDEKIEEVYILAAHARNQGQDFIPVHIFPVKFDNAKSVDFLTKMYKDDPGLKKFADRLEDAYDYFEKHHQLPVVMVNDKGEYIFDGGVKKMKTPVKEDKPVKRAPVPHRTRTIASLPEAIHLAPQYTGGAAAYNSFLTELGKEMVGYLPKGLKKAYVQVEFVIDSDGMPVNFKVLKGFDEEFNDELILRMEKMPVWQPAVLHDKPVARKIKQSVTIEN